MWTSPAGATDVADDTTLVEHTLTVEDHGLERAARRAGHEDSPVWAELNRIREELLWSRMDRMLTAGALVRVAAAGAWLGLALATGAAAGWGVCLLVGGLLSLLHARRGTVMLIADNAGPLGPLVRWLLPYPRTPHVNPIGVLETTGAVIACIGTGWLGGAFETTPAARAAGPAAIALLAVYDASVVVNLTGHVTWEFGPVVGFYSRVRPITSVGCGLIAMAMLWPGHGLGDGYPAAVAATAAATIAIILSGQAAKSLLTSTSRTYAHSVQAARCAVQAVDGQYVHQLKNMARILYRRADEIPAGDLRERVRRLSVAISSTEQMLKSGLGTPARCVEDVVNGLLGLDERFATLRHVDSDVDFRDLTPGDAELVAIAVGDLCSNAVNAGASRFRVGLRADDAAHGAWLTLEAECVCGKPIPEIPEDSSLLRLAALLHHNRGTFVITDDGTSHRFVLRWPTTGRPRALPKDTTTGEGTP